MPSAEGGFQGSLVQSTWLLFSQGLLCRQLNVGERLRDFVVNWGFMGMGLEEIGLNVINMFLKSFLD